MINKQNKQLTRWTKQRPLRLAASLLCGALLLLAGAANAAIVTGSVWKDINADAFQGSSTSNTLGTNILTQADGSNTFGDPVVADAGVESAFVGVTVCETGNAANCTTTDAAGGYSLDIPVGGSITVSAPAGYKFGSDDPANDNDADQQAAAPVPPALWTAQISATSIANGNTNAGIRPSPAITISYFDTNAIASDGEQGVVTGTADFNTLGNCQTSAPYTDPNDANLNLDTALTDPGDDCHLYDNTVRTNDTVNIVPTISVENIPAGGLDNVVIEMQLTLNNGAVLSVETALNGVPSGCETGSSFAPESAVISNADGSITLICNVGSIDTAGNVFRSFAVLASGASPSGSSFDTEMRAYAAANNAVPSDELVAPEIFISALPRFDLTKNSYNGGLGKDGGSPRNTAGIYQRSFTNPVTGEVENGVLLAHQITIMVDSEAGGKGVAALGDSFTFDEIIDPRYKQFGATIYECRNTPWASSWDAPWNGNSSFGQANPDRSTVDNGQWSCETDGSSDTITVTNADTSGSHYPSQGANGRPTDPHKIVVTGYVGVWYPFSAFYRYAGPDKTLGTADDLDTVAERAAVGTTLADWTTAGLWQVGDAPALGSYGQLNCLGEFDPNGQDANGNDVSNYLGGYEPGWDNATQTASGNNCRASSYTISKTGSFTKYFGGSHHLTNGTYKLDNAPAWSWACTRINGQTQYIVPGQTACTSGDGPVTSGQNFTSEVRFSASRSAVDLTKPVICETLDNAVYNVTPITSGAAAGQYAFYTYRDDISPGIDGGATPLGGYVFGTDHGFIVEYARFSAVSGRKTWLNDHAAGVIDPNSGTFPIDHSQQKAAAQDCGAALTAAGTLEWSEDPYAAGDNWSAEDIVMIRVRGEDDSVVIQALDYATLLQPYFVARDTFYAPDDVSIHGQPIPAGTLFANISNYGDDRDDNGEIDYGIAGYDATNHVGTDGATTVAYGDRLIYQTVSVSIEKGAYQFESGSTPDDDDTVAVDVGDRVMWSLHPAVSAVNDVPFANDVTITDVLPQYVTYNPSCTPAPPAGLSGPTVLPDTPALGQTTLVWTYDNPLQANQPLDVISVCSNTDPFAPAQPTLTVQNNVTIEASNIPFIEQLQTADRSVILSQVGAFAVRKEVDFALNFQDQSQVWTLIWANTSDQFPFEAPQIIDVFPYNGDGAGAGSLAGRELYASDFNGSLTLQAIPALPNVEGTTTSKAGDWYASCDAPNTINSDPTAASNALPGGSTEWIAVTAGSTADPSGTCALADVTALRWVSTEILPALQNVEVDITLQTNNNQPNDLYVNRFTGYTGSFPTAPVSSNELYVQVIGFSVGDLLWLDLNGNGLFDEGTDVTAPAGVNINLFYDDGSVATDIHGNSTVQTNADGRWFFEGLSTTQVASPGNDFVVGEFYVTVDNLPVGWQVDGTSSTFAADPNSDLNEDGDHHTLLDMGTLVRSSGNITLSASVDGVGLITGYEPTGDNVELLGDPLIRDDLTNFTLDLMFVPAVGDIRVTKSVQGGGSIEGWQFEVSAVDPVGCVLPTSLSNPALTDASGVVLFEDLLVNNTQTGATCQYNVTEAARDGWTLSSQTPAGPYTVSVGSTVAIAVTNTRDVGNIAVTKTVNGTTAPTGWEFTLSSLVAGCDIPASVVNPATTADGSGGTVTFTGLPTHSETSGDACSYQVAETAQTGWTQVTAAADLTNLAVNRNQTTTVAVQNSQWPDLVVNKQVTPAEQLAGGELQYTISVANSGGLPATSVVLTDVLPQGLSYVNSAPSAGTFDSASGNWTVGTLLVGANASLVLTVRLEPVAGVCAPSYQNTVTVTSQGETDFDASNNQDSATAQWISLAVTQMIVGSPVELGNDEYEVQFDIELINQGGVVLTALQIEDDIRAMIDARVVNDTTFEVVSVDSPDSSLTPNPQFDGETDTALLLGTDSLAAGARGKLSLKVKLRARLYMGMYEGQLTATAETATGVQVSDLSEDLNSPSTSSDCIVDSPTELDLDNDPNTPITLGSFKAALVDGEVVFNWTTQTEVANLGFYLYVKSQDRWRRLNERLIPSHGDSVGVQRYRATARTNGKVFGLGDVDLYGSETIHGPFHLGEQHGIEPQRKLIDWAREGDADKGQGGAATERERLELQQMRRNNQRRKGGAVQ